MEMTRRSRSGRVAEINPDTEIGIEADLSALSGLLNRDPENPLVFHSINLTGRFAPTCEPGTHVRGELRACKRLADVISRRVTRPIGRARLLGASESPGIFRVACDSRIPVCFLADVRTMTHGGLDDDLLIDGRRLLVNRSRLARP